MNTVYLLHFDEPLHHARHYLGTTKNLPFRLQQHRRGEGSPLVKAVLDAGICVHLANTWEGGHALERQLKNRHNSPKICPICQAEKRIRGLMGEGGTPQ